MFTKFDNKFQRKMTIINPGEYYATNDDEVIVTVLGSCVSVCLFDQGKRLAGMNHFMLVGDLRDEEIYMNPNARYGIFAMEVLFNELIKRGGNKKNFACKVFGGGHVLNYKKSTGNVPENNIRFVRSFLKLEGVPILSEDLGGYSGRKIIFFTDDQRVLLKRLKSTVDPAIIAEEEYERKMLDSKAKELNDRMTFFD